MTALSNREIRNGLFSNRLNLISSLERTSSSIETGFHAIAPDRRLRSSSFGAGGLLPDRDLEEGLINDERLSGFAVEPEPLPEQIQAASLELRVGDLVYYMKGDFTSLKPGEVKKYARGCKKLKAGERVTINPGEICVVRSLERIRLPVDYYGISDIRSRFARVGVGGGAAVTKHGVIGGESYLIEPEYVYFKVIAHAFPIILVSGETRPLQVWFRKNGSGTLSAQEVEKDYGKHFGLMRGGKKIAFDDELVDENGLGLNVRTSGYYVQKPGKKKPLDVMLKEEYNWEEYFNFVEDGDSLIVKPRRLYLLGSKEEIFLSPLICGDLARSPDTIGHGLSNNFARLFNPGYRGEITLEVYSYANKNWILIDGQNLGRVLLERLDSAPLCLYGGSFQGQKAPKLPGCFKE